VATQSPIGWSAYRIIDAKVGARGAVRDCLALPIFRGTRESNLAKWEKSSAVDAGSQPPGLTLVFLLYQKGREDRAIDDFTLKGKTKERHF
jgi:hypothetical protein